MIFDVKPLESINEQDLLTLVADQVAERRVIEYKRELHTSNHDQKKEFLADCTSFANASGGYILYGVEEDKGTPIALNGFITSDVDATKQQLENLLRDSVQPRITGYVIHPVTLSNGNIVLVIRIPKSWNSPHVVNSQGHWRFYSRNSAGKYPLDVPELRSAFTASATVNTRIREFRADRLSQIIANETPAPLGNHPKMILHSIPLNAFDPTVSYNFSLLMNDNVGKQIVGRKQRYNLDGLLGYEPLDEGLAAHNYTQIFRNGVMEYVDAKFLRSPIKDGNYFIFPSQQYENILLSRFNEITVLQNMLGIKPPFVIMLSILSVKGFLLTLGHSFNYTDLYPIDRKDLIIPEILIESTEGDLAQILKPLFDSVWNASGWPRSMNYNHRGEYIHRSS